jgi:hypothetical protein
MAREFQARLFDANSTLTDVHDDFTTLAQARGAAEVAMAESDGIGWVEFVEIVPAGRLERTTDFLFTKAKK